MKRHGVGLVEVVVVIIILGIIAAVVVPPLVERAATQPETTQPSAEKTSSGEITLDRYSEDVMVISIVEVPGQISMRIVEVQSQSNPARIWPAVTDSESLGKSHYGRLVAGNYHNYRGNLMVGSMDIPLFIPREP